MGQIRTRALPVTSSTDGFMSFALKAFLGEMERRQVKYRPGRLWNTKSAIMRLWAGLKDFSFSQCHRGMHPPEAASVKPMAGKIVEHAKSLQTVECKTCHSGPKHHQNFSQTAHGKLKPIHTNNSGFQMVMNTFLMRWYFQSSRWQKKAIIPDSSKTIPLIST